MRTRFRFEKLEAWQKADLDPLFDEMERLAEPTVALNHALQVDASKTPFSRPARS